MMRVTTEENVKEVLAEIDEEIVVLDGLRALTPGDKWLVERYVSRKWGLETARMIIVSHLNFE